VNAARKILEKKTAVLFDFVGFLHTEESKAALESLKRDFPENVTHRVLEPGDMPRVYQEADITIVPTLWSEGTSLSCLEAQASGNAVIATNVGGLPNLVIDGYNGLLINPYEDELLAAMEKLIADRELREKLAANALAVAQAFDKEIWRSRWEKIIEETNGRN
jgi:glycosyltransferase involved in cell wall biosynthesis